MRSVNFILGLIVENKVEYEEISKENGKWVQSQWRMKVKIFQFLGLPLVILTSRLIG